MGRGNTKEKTESGCLLGEKVMLPVKDYKKQRILAIKENEIFSLIAGAIRLKVVFIALFAIIALFTTQLVFANSLATDGEKLSQVQKEIKRLERENMSLKAEIAQSSALSNLSIKAKGLGFTKPTNVTIIK